MPEKNNLTVLVMDGQGGRIGRSLVEGIKEALPKAHIIGIGTNAMATAVMLKAGCDEAATGENPVIVCAPKADVILGPVGIVIANALLGEVTPAMARAVGESPASRILIPVEKCNTLVAGVDKTTIPDVVSDAIQILKSFC